MTGNDNTLPVSRADSSGLHDDSITNEGSMLTDELLTVDQVADILGVQPGHLYNMRSLDKGPRCHRRGRRVYYFSSDVAAYVSHERSATTKGEIR